MIIEVKYKTLTIRVNLEDISLKVENFKKGLKLSIQKEYTNLENKELAKAFNVNIQQNKNVSNNLTINYNSINNSFHHQITNYKEELRELIEEEHCYTWKLFSLEEGLIAEEKKDSDYLKVDSLNGVFSQNYSNCISNSSSNSTIVNSNTATLITASVTNNNNINNSPNSSNNKNSNNDDVNTISNTVNTCNTQLNNNHNSNSITNNSNSSSITTSNTSNINMNINTTLKEPKKLIRLLLVRNFIINEQKPKKNTEKEKYESKEEVGDLIRQVTGGKEKIKIDSIDKKKRISDIFNDESGDLILHALMGDFQSTSSSNNNQNQNERLNNFRNIFFPPRHSTTTSTTNTTTSTNNNQRELQNRLLQSLLRFGIRPGQVSSSSNHRRHHLSHHPIVPNQQKINQLLEMGFAEDRARRALIMSRNNLESAVEIIANDQDLGFEENNNNNNSNNNNNNSTMMDELNDDDEEFDVEISEENEGER